MQYTKRDWRNRNKIKTPNGLKWLTIPVEVKGKYYQKINETKVADCSWVKSHLALLKQNYKEAEHFKEFWPIVENEFLNINSAYLTEINVQLIKFINKFLNINTEIRLSSEFNLNKDKNIRLIDICKDLNGSDYFSGPAAKSYIDENAFNEQGIKVNYINYSNYKTYNQLHNDFTHHVSILDLIFNQGENAKTLYKS